MPSVAHRLDRFISRRLSVTNKAVRELLVRKKIIVDGEVASLMNQAIGPFTFVVVDGTIIQQRQPVYLMMNKPKGVVCATKDDKHKTVLDLVDHPLKSELHIAGRLDFNTTGLLLLTNDGAWSKQLSLPENNIMKKYRVTLKDQLSSSDVLTYQKKFSEGVFLSSENITTRPATLLALSSNIVELSICEGRYHQVKRMFGFFQNEVLELHRLSVGSLEMEGGLALGQYRVLTPKEIDKSP